MADNEAKIETINKIVTGNEDGFPKEVLPALWTKVFQGSVMQALSGSVPVSLAGGAVPMPTSQPVAGIVAEGGVKPVVDIKTSIKTLTPVKTAAIFIYSEEAARANPLHTFDQLEATLAEAIARSIDTAIIHGKDALTGEALVGKESLMSTTNKVKVDPAKLNQAADPAYLFKQVLAAQDLVILDDEDDDDKEGFDVTGVLASKKLRTPLLSAVDTHGRPMYQGSLDVTNQFGNVLGLPCRYSKAIHGYGKVKEKSNLAIIGDFGDNLRMGFEQGMTWRRAAERAGGVDLFDRNLRAILVEATFGWLLRDKDAFALLHTPAAVTP